MGDWRITVRQSRLSKFMPNDLRYLSTQSFFVLCFFYGKLQLFSLLNLERNQSRSQADISTISSYILLEYFHPLMLIKFETVAELPFCFHLKIFFLQSSAKQLRMFTKRRVICPNKNGTGKFKFWAWTPFLDDG